MCTSVGSGSADFFFEKLGIMRKKKDFLGCDGVSDAGGRTGAGEPDSFLPFLCLNDLDNLLNENVDRLACGAESGPLECAGGADAGVGMAAWAGTGVDGVVSACERRDIRSDDDRASLGRSDTGAASMSLSSSDQMCVSSPMSSGRMCRRFEGA